MQAAQFVSFLCLLHVVVAYHRPLRPEPSTFRAAAAPGDASSSAGVPTDLVLSSGFCAFARQAGVLAALQDFNIQVDRCVGTSSGSLAASMFAAGMTPLQIADELSRQRPIALCQPSLRVHRGAFSLRGLVAHLRTLLPKVSPAAFAPSTAPSPSLHLNIIKMQRGLQPTRTQTRRGRIRDVVRCVPFGRRRRPPCRRGRFLRDPVRVSTGDGRQPAGAHGRRRRQGQVHASHCVSTVSHVTSCDECSSPC